MTSKAVGLLPPIRFILSRTILASDLTTRSLTHSLTHSPGGAGRVQNRSGDGHACSTDTRGRRRHWVGGEAEGHGVWVHGIFEWDKCFWFSCVPRIHPKVQALLTSLKLCAKRAMEVSAINKPTNRPINQSTNQLINQIINQSTNQPNNQSTNQLINRRNRHLPQRV